jgi:hypothetical protein
MSAPATTSRRSDPCFWLLGAMALGSAGNAVWMLADPARWYRELPAGVPDTGPYNEHFVRDIGCAFAAVALALAWAAWRPRWRPPLVAIAAFFLVAHAALHVFDTLRGFLDADHWALDLPGVYAPAAIAAGLALYFLRAHRERR